MIKEEMRVRYWELMDAREKILKQSGPLRKQREEVKEKMAPFEKTVQELRNAIIKIERPDLPEIDQERAMIQKALSGRVGEKPSGKETMIIGKDDVGELKV